MNTNYEYEVDESFSSWQKYIDCPTGDHFGRGLIEDATVEISVEISEKWR